MGDATKLRALLFPNAAEARHGSNVGNAEGHFVADSYAYERHRGALAQLTEMAGLVAASSEITADWGAGQSEHRPTTIGLIFVGRWESHWR